MKPLMTAKVLDRVEEISVEGTKILCRATEGADGEVYWVLEENRRRVYGDAAVIIIDPLDWLADDGKKVAQVVQ